MKIKKYLVLPREISPFEKSYLERLNKVALVFFFLHVPVFMGVAWIAGTGPLFALALTLFVLIGPTLAYKTIENPRHLSVVYGITSQLMGGLLVHFGQGPVQIEMHFYFFALLAMLCMFSNPTVNIAAAITVILHHLIVWWLIPSSVFNYDAEFWVVLVHAVFVILETTAACYISREFFDNVIGLEKIVEARTETIKRNQRDMRLILDNVETGLVTVAMTGEMSSECSQAVTKWFGAPMAGEKIETWLGERDVHFREWLQLGFESIEDGFLPSEVALAQLPRLLKDDSSAMDKTYEFQYQFITDNEGVPEKILVIINDITAKVKNEQAGKHQADLLRLFQHMMNDKHGFIDFLTESEDIVGLMRSKAYTNLEHLKRLLHTLKGNSAMFELQNISQLCHDLESLIAEEGLEPPEDRMNQLMKAWEYLRLDISKLMDGGTGNAIEIDDAEYEAILKAVLGGTKPRIIAQMIESWRLEPANKRLERVRQQIKGLAHRMGKDHVQVQVEHNTLRFSRERFGSFWSAFVHVLRNAVDHGVENKQERLKSGKPENSLIKVSTAIKGEHFVVAVEDDGPGINWSLLQAKADELGVADYSKDNPEEVLFLSGVSSKRHVTEFSGRGIGMGVLQEACQELQGSIEVFSQKCIGTKVQFSFPADHNIYIGHSALLQQVSG